MTNEAVAQRLEEVRDMRVQISELSADDAKEMSLQEFSPGRKILTLYSMTDGEQIDVPQYIAAQALSKRLADGRYAFTAFKTQAPAYKEGNVRCFLADDSPERESGLLAEAGLDHLPPCPAKHLRSTLSKRVHGQNRHIQAWPTLQEYLQEKDREETRTEQRKQTDAMLALAGQRSVNEEGEDRPRRGRPPKSE